MSGIKGPKEVPRKHPPVDTSHVGSMDSCLLTPNSSETGIHQTRLCFFSPQLSSFGEPEPGAASDFCSWLTGVEPDVVLCLGVGALKSGYLSYLSLSVSYNQSGQLSVINTAFLQKAKQHTDHDTFPVLDCI